VKDPEDRGTLKNVANNPVSKGKENLNMAGTFSGCEDLCLVSQ